MNAPGPTIIDLKLAFLRSQILALSSPLSVPATYRPNESENALRQRSIDDALYKLNLRLKEQSRLAYSSRAQQHVAEQIDSLYWKAGERDVISGRKPGELDKGSDLTLDKNIENLPDEWGERGEEEEEPENARMFVELSETLHAFSTRRAEMKQKVARYKAMKEALASFEDAKENLQENLCTKDGELEKELEKMRMLMARVSGRIEGLPPSGSRGGDEQEMDLDIFDEEAKLNALMKAT